MTYDKWGMHMRWDKKNKPYTIHIHFGQENLQEIIEGLAKQVIQKHVDIVDIIHSKSSGRSKAVTEADRVRTNHGKR